MDGTNGYMIKNGPCGRKLAKRIIPCLDVKAGRTVKGVNFEHLRDAGDIAVSYTNLICWIWAFRVVGFLLLFLNQNNLPGWIGCRGNALLLLILTR